MLTHGSSGPCLVAPTDGLHNHVVLPLHGTRTTRLCIKDFQDARHVLMEQVHHLVRYPLEQGVMRSFGHQAVECHIALGVPGFAQVNLYLAHTAYLVERCPARRQARRLHFHGHAQLHEFHQTLGTAPGQIAQRSPHIGPRQRRRHCATRPSTAYEQSLGLQLSQRLPYCRAPHSEPGRQVTLGRYPLARRYLAGHEQRLELARHLAGDGLRGYRLDPEPVVALIVLFHSDP
ncbi:MAG: hypothetical protein BWY79_01055 [Actinobacteria bacterium ADurb.Bin444]|nr:MAG: hypothetical protein BWY79_01055 [Actinobacteria bacterium ADurb.Bin444]